MHDSWLIYANRAARLKGFEEGLDLHGQEFATLLSILYVGYIIMQIPSFVLFSILAIMTDVWVTVTCS